MKNKLSAVRTISLLALLMSTVAQAATGDETTIRSGSDWQIVQVGNEYRVTVTRDQPAPIRSAYPSLIIDGIKYKARLSKDRRTLIVPIGKEQVDTVRDVNTGEAIPKIRAQHSALQAKTPVARAVGQQVADPAERGPFQVTRADYNFGDEVLPIAGSSIKSELRAAVYLPAGGKNEARPVVVFLHGMHGSCYKDYPTNEVWPCPDDYLTLNNYQGYDAPAEALASHGYVVISISSNGINIAANAFNRVDSDFLPESTLRGKLVLDHLDLLAKANAGEVKELISLQGQLDLQRVGLMGHSRGGEGVARAVLMNAVRSNPYGIEAILPLAATSPLYDLAIPHIPMATILPFCDGDVTELEGQKYVDLSRHAFDDDVLRSSVLMMGANHNYFNTTWSPGYPGGRDDADMWMHWGDPTCGNPAIRLTQEEQVAVGTAYIAGFFRMTMGDEKQFLPLFDGSNVEVPGVPRADVRSSATFPTTARYDLQSFDTGNLSAIPPQGGAWSWMFPQGAGEIRSPYSMYGVRFPHGNTFLQVDGQTSTNPAKLTLSPKLSAVDASAYSYLSFRLGRTASGDNVAPLKLWAELGNSRVQISDDNLALHMLPTIENIVGKTAILQQVRVPLSAFDPADLHDVKQASLVVSGQGKIQVSDVAFVTPAIGKGAPSKLPSIRIEDTDIDPSPYAREIPLRITLSSASANEVSMAVSQSVEKTVLFAAGETEKIVSIRVPGGLLPGGCPIYVSAVRNAFVDRDVARLRIRGEDADSAMVCNALSPAYSEYSEGTIYKGGDTVSNAGGVYACKSYPNSGWCGQAKSYYAPGTGSAWQDAWTRK